MRQPQNSTAQQPRSELREWIAKFPARNDDPFDVPTAEYAMLELARHAGTWSVR